MLIYEWLIFAPLFAITTIVLGITAIIGCKFGNPDFWGYYPGVCWARITLALALCPIKVEGRKNLDPNQSYIFVANHQGATDIIMLFGYLGQPFRWMLRQGIKKAPVLGPFCEISGQIWVDESGAKGILHTVRQALTILKRGKSMVVFPEGTRSNDGKLHRFKKGAFAIAAMIKLPVVPVTIVNSYQTMPKGTTTLHPHRLKLIIEKPLPAVTKEEGNEAG
ncbi:MAG: 1-acyl-sn-glycerol-3-phosphate acyltransferase, partial [Bacteroidales bacterium]|nr:1-acyl-sn-glycerol-3-phosphate acyltransferase [Bacteroidales bacterium]